MENIDIKIKEKNKEKRIKEQQISMLNQQLISANKAYLILLGELKAYLEMKKAADDVIEDIEEIKLEGPEDADK